jgi:hypothetical protein
MQGTHVLFLTPCHATPWHAHMHNPGAQMTFLDCSPSGLHRAVVAQNTPLATGLFHLADGVAGHSTAGQAWDEQRVFEAAPLDHLCRVFGCSRCAAVRRGVPRRAASPRRVSDVHVLWSAAPSTACAAWARWASSQQAHSCT